jgi:hypothetical protein
MILKPAGYRVILAASLLAAACSQAPDGSSATANRANRAGPANAAAPSNGAAAAPARGPLAAYAGKLTSDNVGGSTFVARPEVRRAVESLVPDAGARRWLLNPDSTQSPIELRGGKLYSSACEPHNCGPHQWTILIGADGAGAEICYHDDRQDAAHSRWYAAGRPPETRLGYCTPA